MQSSHVAAPSPSAATQAEVSEYRTRVRTSFLSHYAAAGSLVAEPVGISSGVDKSVHFVGAAICGFKDIIAGQAIPAGGVAVAQPSFRARNAKRLLEPGFEFEWGGYFVNVAVIAPITLVQRMFDTTIAYFADVLGFEHDQILHACVGP